MILGMVLYTQVLKLNMGSYGELTGIREMHAITFTVTLQSCARARAPDARQHSALASIVGVRSGPFILFTIAKSEAPYLSAVDGKMQSS